MSHDAIIFVRDGLPHIKGPDRAILFALASRANWEQTGLDECFPSIDTIAQDSGVDRATIFRRLPALRDAGLVAVYANGRSNRYTIQTPGEFWCAARKALHGEGPAMKFGPVVHTRLSGRRLPARADQSQGATVRADAATSRRERPLQPDQSQGATVRADAANSRSLPRKESLPATPMVAGSDPNHNEVKTKGIMSEDEAYTPKLGKPYLSPRQARSLPPDDPRRNRFMARRRWFQ